jgi:hypothetical protein
MRRLFSSVAVGVAATAVIASTALGAAAATSTSTAKSAATTKCQAIDAPTAMNDLPASADCNLSTPKAGGIRTTLVSPLANPVNPTTPIQSTPLPFDRTNGDILAINKIDGTNDLAFGGNFSLVYTPDGVSHPAIDFAIVDEATGAVLYAGTPSNGSSADKYVRSIASLNGVVYVGGDFTSWDGAGRSHTARLAPTGAPAPAEYAVTSWNPAPSSMVRGLAVDSSAVYLGVGGSAVRAVNPTTGATIWSKSVTGGDIHVVFEDQGFLFVGGLFETYNGVTQHGLVKVQLSDGSMVTAFNAHLRADTGIGQYGSYDGEEIISATAAPNSGEIFVGSGGHAPAGDSSNEPMLLNITTGARLWSYSTTGDCQAIGAVGDTAVAGYHNNGPNAGNPLSANYFGIQLEDSNAAPTTWDPRVNGNQGNADGGNNGVQAIYVDQSTQTIYLAGAFVHWNGTTGLTHQSLIAFSFAPTAATVPGAPTNATAVAGNASATVSWTAPVSNGGSPITGYTVTASPGGATQGTTGATTVAVAGLTNGTAYTFTVVATNAVGPSALSAPSNSVTPVAPAGGLSNTAEGGTAGVSVTAGNSGGGSGSAFTVIGKGSGAALVFSAAAAAHGSLGYALTGSSGTGTLMGWNGFGATSMAVRFYYNPGPTLPNSVLRLADIRNSAATAARVELSASNQLFIQNTAGSTLTTFPHALQANTWYRIELTISVSSSSATIKAAYYLGSSTTPIDPAYATSTGNTGTANITQVSIGSAASATWTGTSYFDDLAAESGSTAFIGP